MQKCYRRKLPKVLLLCFCVHIGHSLCIHPLNIFGNMASMSNHVHSANSFDIKLLFLLLSDSPYLGNGIKPQLNCNQYNADALNGI